MKYASARRYLSPLLVALVCASFGAYACGSDPERGVSSEVDAGKKKDSGKGDTSVDYPDDVDADEEDPPTGDTNVVWPDCATQPAGSTAKLITDVWAANPATATGVWLPGVYVTAISKGGCVAGSSCQIFVQQDQTYDSLAAGAKHAIRLFVSAAGSTFFSSIKPGDQVNVYAYAARASTNGQNELALGATSNYPGCATKIGSGSPTPITGVKLSDLSVSSYEDTVGPLLVKISNVIGTPQGATEIFGLGDAIYDGGAGGAIVSLSPYCEAGGSFTGLTSGTKTKFTSVSGVFGMFVPPTDASVSKYLVVYPRSAADIVKP